MSQNDCCTPKKTNLLPDCHMSQNLHGMSRDIMSGTSLQSGSSSSLLSVIRLASVDSSTHLLWRAFAATTAQERLSEFAHTVRQEVRPCAMQHNIFVAYMQLRLHI